MGTCLYELNMRVCMNAYVKFPHMHSYKHVQYMSTQPNVCNLYLGL